MKARNSARVILFIMAVMVVSLVFTVISVPTIDVAYAENTLEDNVGGNSSSSSNSDSSDGDDLFGGLKDQEIDPEDKGVSDWLKDQRGVNSKQLESATQTMSPITNIIGYITGGIIILTVVGVVAITALDLLYIAVPPTRNFLYKAGTDGTGGFTGGYGAGGFGRMGGMSMGAGGAAQGTNKPTQWVSDEAVNCAAMLGGSAQSSQGGMMPGMGMGYGAMGAMGAQQQQGQMKTKSVIAMYFKKRLFFLILLAICIIVLTSSAIMNCGVNLAEWFLKIVNMLNGKMSA
jgi:hypothetical protein